MLVSAPRGKVTGFDVSCLVTFRVARDAYGAQIRERPTNRFWLSSPDKTAPHSSLLLKPRIGFRVPALRCDLEGGVDAMSTNRARSAALVLSAFIVWPFLSNAASAALWRRAAPAGAVWRCS